LDIFSLAYSLTRFTVGAGYMARIKMNKIPGVKLELFPAVSAIMQGFMIM